MKIEGLMPPLLRSPLAFSPHLFNIDGSRDIFVVAFGCAVSVGSDLGLSHFVMVGL